jgi:hypothetical protein
VKEKDLYVDFKSQQSVYYVEKADESYGPVISGSHLAKYYLDDFYEKMHRQEQALREKLKAGEISPVYYYYIIREFGEGDLASRVGINLRKLRKHYKMENFIKIKLSLLKKYAETFDVPVANMFHLVMTRQEFTEKLRIVDSETKNPFFVISKIEAKEE